MKWINYRNLLEMKEESSFFLHQLAVTSGVENDNANERVKVSGCGKSMVNMWENAALREWYQKKAKTRRSTGAQLHVVNASTLFKNEQQSCNRKKNNEMRDAKTMPFDNYEEIMNVHGYI